MEIWKDVVGYEGSYMVSNLGNVKSLNWRGLGIAKNLYLKKHNKGYLQVELAKNGSKKMITVHRLVATAFIENPNGLPQVNHMDEDKTNNRSDNLEWCDQRYNIRYSSEKHGGRRNGKCSNVHIMQCSKDGTVIRTWKSSRDVFLETGMSAWSVSECCKGKRKTAYGFKWRYSTDHSGRESAL